jgi:hypothetical protein
MGLDALSIIGCITQAMMYSVLGSEPLVYIALGFIGGSIVTYLLVKVHNKYQDRIIQMDEAGIYFNARNWNNKGGN